MSRRGWLLLLAGVAGAGAGIVWATGRGPTRLAVDAGVVTRQGTFTSTVTASGEIVATRYADIGSSVMGTIISLPVREGDAVEAGQVLARIDPVQAESDVAGATAQVSALEAEEAAAAGQARVAASDLAAAEARARDASQVAARRLRLFEAGLIPASEQETARAATEAADAQVSGARAAIERAEAAFTAATRRIAQARAQERRAQDVLDKTAIVSPINGVVTRLQVREGEMVVIGVQNQPGTTLMTVSDLGEIDAEVKVAEADVLRLELDQPAAVTLEAMPGRAFTGRVVEIGAGALPLEGTGAAAREFRVVVRLDRPEPGLRPGLTCDAEITTSRRSDVLTVPLQSVVLRPDDDGTERTGVFVIRDEQAVFTPVPAGIIGGLDIEVTGIPDGESIVIGPYQVLRELEDGAQVSVTDPGR
ncbi:MAG: efflux RND transporter periplasmic adaptor subunit [Acidobacteria bacterium]|nr:efflux RND transporter periplasmic adaptor subunit [Acidobacteriota bacterium]